MYVCGMTPKDRPHIGHARLFVHVDVMRRYLEYKGYDVLHVQNFTDVDDKIIERARAAGREPIELAAENTEAYFDVMDRLNVMRAHVFPKVTDNIDAIITAIEELLGKEYAYTTSKGVYFEVRRWPEYGRLSGRSQEDVMAGARVDIDPEKRDPRDFALWKRHKEGEIFWDSPWGPGRPGWHIECSSMIREHLGPQIDIHWGGSDLIFPHHENELAQAEAGFGVAPFVRVWMHLAVLLTKGEKMGHSSGNFVTLEEVFQHFRPQVVRLYLISTKYRSPVDYSDDSLQQAEVGWERFWNVMRATPAANGEVQPEARTDLKAAIENARSRLESALDDDLNTSAALASLFDLGREVNRLAGGASPEDLQAAKRGFSELAGILGLEQVAAIPVDGEIEPLIELLVDVRSKLREEKVWGLSDHIRAELARLGVTIEDGSSGTTWRRN